jgi:fatty-acyl-CoA synthase
MTMTASFREADKTAYPFTYPVGKWTKKWAERNPDKPVIIDIDNGKQCTAAGLHLRSESLAAGLLELGLKKGDVLAVVLKNSIEFMELYFACAKTGVIFMPLNFHLTPTELEYQVKLVEPSVLVCDEDLTDTVKALLHTGVRFTESNVYCLRMPGSRGKPDFTDYESLFNGTAGKVTVPAGTIDNEDTQVIMFTSGTTGRAKGCMLSFRKTFFNTLNDVLVNDDRPEDRNLLNLPLYHSYGLNIITLPALYAGATVYMQSGMNIENLCRTIEEQQINKWMTITLMGRLLINSDMEKRYSLPSLKYFFMGGEPVPEHVVKSLQSKWPHMTVTAGFGTTETSLCLTLPHEHTVAKAGSAGRPLFFSDIRIVDKSNNDVKPGEQGELLIGGPTVFSGYWKNQKATREAIDNRGYFHTGDIVRRDAEGFVFVVEREKEVVISGGENIYPAEVDGVISRHPCVAEVAVIGIPDAKWGERPIAVIVPKDGKVVTTDEIRQFCTGKLAKYKIPDRVELTDSLPHTGPGKIARWQLKAKYGGGIAK